MKKYLFFPALMLPLLTACIGDDVIFDAVPEAVRIIASVDTLGVGDSFQFAAQYTNEIGLVVARPVNWSSSDPEVAVIDGAGLATGISAGEATIRAEVAGSSEPVFTEFRLVVDAQTSAPNTSTRQGTIRTTSSYVLQGSFVLREVPGSGLSLEIGSDYRASNSLPGFYLYLTNNPNSVNGALEIGRVSVFSGQHSYNIPNVTLQQYSHLLYYCKPFNVKVGDGEIKN